MGWRRKGSGSGAAIASDYPSIFPGVLYERPFWTTPDSTISFKARAVAIAVINAVGNIGSGLSPLMIGILHDLTGSFSAGLWFMTGLLAAGAGVMARIPMGQQASATPVGAMEKG